MATAYDTERVELDTKFLPAVDAKPEPTSGSGLHFC